MDDSILHNRLQLFLADTKRRLHLVQRVHKVRPRDLDVLNVLKCCNRSDLPSVITSR